MASYNIPSSGFNDTDVHDDDDDVKYTSEWKGLSSLLWIYCAPVIFVIGITGNVLILLIINRKKFRGTTTSVYLGFLAIADGLVLITGMIPEWLSADGWIIFKEISATTCKIDKVLSFTIGDVAIWILVAFTVDRCMAVCFPFEKAGISTPKRAKIICAGLLIFGIIKNFHMIWTRGPIYETIDNKTVFIKNCGRPEPYTYFETYIRPWIAFSLINFIPFFMIIVCNSMMIHALIKSREVNKQQMIMSNSNNHFKQLTLMCLSASFAFLVFVTPSIVLLIGKPYFDDPDNEAYLISKAVNNQLSYLNHSVNFFLYCLTGRRFRHELWFLLCSCTKLNPPFSDSDYRPAPSTIPSNINGTPMLSPRSQPPSPMMQNRLSPKPIYHSTPAIHLIAEKVDTSGKNGCQRLGDDLNTTSCV